MEKQVYISLLGRSCWALVNAYYAVLKHKELQPDLIYFFTEEFNNDEGEKVVQGLTIISEEFGFVPEIQWSVIPSSQMFSADSEMLKTFASLSEKRYHIHLDITPGRKALVASALLSINQLIRSNSDLVKNIFYLDVFPLEANPYMMIPKSTQLLRNFLMEGSQGASE